MIEIKNITKIYDGKEKVVALDDVSLDLPDKGIVFIVGASGSGKTTLMNIITGIEKATIGDVIVDKRVYSDLSNSEKADYRNIDIGIVFQDFNLIDEMTVRNNFLIPLLLQEGDKNSYNDRIDDVLKTVDLLGYANRKCNNLSAGQRQRIAIARALIKNPKAIFADEPSGNLDPENTDIIMKLFNKISEDRLIVLISHDMISAQKYGDRIIKISNGKIVEDIDNTKIKRISNQEYLVKIKSKEDEKIVSLDEFDIKKEFTEIADWNDKCYEKLELDMDITFCKNIDSIELPFDESVKSAKGVKLFDKMKYMLYLNQKDFMRYFFSLILITFISTLFLLGYILYENNFAESISKYFESSGIRLIEAEKYIKTENDEETIRNGKEHFEKLQGYSDGKVFKCISNADIYLDAVEDGDVIDLLYADDYKEFQGISIEGELPNNNNNNNEIAIDYRFANNKGVSLGDIVYVNDIKCIVHGILKENISNNQNIAIISSKVVSNYIEDMNCINLQGIDVTKSVSIKDFVDGINSIGNISQFGDEIKLINGRKPNKDNEIIISDQLADEIGYIWTKDMNTTYRLPNLYSNKYNGKYDYLINLYDYIGKKVEIVGVYSTKEYSECGNIVFQDNIYFQIKEYYIKYLNFDYCTIFMDDNSNELISEITNDSYRIENDTCSKIYYIKGIKDNLNDSIKIVIAVLIFMFIVVLIFALSLFVSNNKHEIGVLRSIGVRDEDIRMAYLIDGVLKCFFSVVAAYSISCLITQTINNRIYSFIEVERVDVLSINHILLFVVSFGMVVVGVSFVILPLLWYFKKSTSELLKE